MNLSEVKILENKYNVEIKFREFRGKLMYSIDDIKVELLNPEATTFPVNGATICLPKYVSTSVP